MLTINEFLCNYSKDHKLDKTFRLWLFEKDKSNPKKTLTEWEMLFNAFLNETA